MIRALLGRVTMYRIVTIVLLALAVVAFVLTATSRLDPSIFTLRGLLATLAVLVVTSVVADHLLGLVVRRRPHTESAVITALLLWFIYWPTLDVGTLAWLGLTAVAAQASKYVLVWRARHVFNPAAAGAVLMILLGELLGDRVDNPPPSTTWWVASESMAWFVLLGALVVLYRTGRFALAITFAVPAALLTYWNVSSFYPELGQSLEYVAYSTPIVFFAAFMLTEPLTLAPRRAQQLVLAVAAAVVFTWPLWTTKIFDAPIVLGPFEGTYELALVGVNLVAFLLGQRGGVRLRLLESRELGGDLHEFRFEPRRRVRLRAGQYLELQLSHAADVRGERRAFTIASVPDADTVDIAVRVPEDCSSFKRELAALQPGDEVHATGVSGDFLWPRGAGPVLLVAGGIGVTPFLSQVRHEPSRDAVLVYGVPSAANVPYRDELVAAGTQVVLVAPDEPVDLPDGWTHVRESFVTGEVVREAVPDASDRRAFVSGPPAMVSPVATDLRKHRIRVKTDHFTGY
ncbi:FAD-dependent oxidoreductase [Aeromicrobium sp. Leaf350]|uniref:FAD-dependent oxidoreductase n=1 Tax=Aeromicrobium sp. Leaf350 TaxID=2876565 RepID=UPI001E598F0C|nr:FAD-dependent oxidoreductase [Aeromicrobium sp. Leaf350]